MLYSVLANQRQPGKEGHTVERPPPPLDIGHSYRISGRFVPDPIQLPIRFFICRNFPIRYETLHCTQTRELMRQEGEIEEERRLAAKMLEEARTTAPRLATMGSITEHRNRWVAYKVLTENKIPCNNNRKLGCETGRPPIVRKAVISLRRILHPRSCVYVCMSWVYFLSGTLKVGFVTRSCLLA